MLAASGESGTRGRQACAHARVRRTRLRAAYRYGRAVQVSWLANWRAANRSGLAYARLGGGLSPRAQTWLENEAAINYVSWREACEQVDVRYERWRRSSELQERDAAFAAYRAALDCEERAAALYAEVAKLLRPGMR